ncbi:MAG TPA: S41 family peptidase [Pyrinomonadaceae bacterium]|nr:S41 family peptidase [Pyrinomonadaceae bacterium]
MKHHHTAVLAVHASARKFILTVVGLCVVGLLAPQALRAQSFDRIERERALTMLSNVKDQLKKHYYDPNIRGMDVDARFKAAEEKIKQAASLGQAFGIIAQVLLDLDDSHTKFYPPSRPNRVDYGWEMQMIGEDCYVVAVKPGSDAAAQGLKEGDRVIAVERFQPTRKEFWKMRYFYNTLSPRAGFNVIVQSPGGQPRELNLKAKVTQGQRVLDLRSDLEINAILREMEDDAKLARHRYYEDIGGVFVWKMPAFDLQEDKVDEIMSKARGRKAMVLDLRGNGGGAESTLLRLLGHFFDHDVKMADIKTRKESKPVIAKTRGKNNLFEGKVVVLVDSDSGSASEVFARVMQLEKRGTVIGDRSAGAVMRSIYRSYEMGTERIVSWGANITNADAIMSDGKSLEKVGVIPDELMLPTPTDMAAKRDPVLARAFELAGIKIDPAKAGTMFPVEWKK